MLFPLLFIVCSVSCMWHTIIHLHYVFMIMSPTRLEFSVSLNSQYLERWSWQMTVDTWSVGHWLAHCRAQPSPWGFHFTWQVLMEQAHLCLSEPTYYVPNVWKKCLLKAMKVFPNMVEISLFVCKDSNFS